MSNYHGRIMNIPAHEDYARRESRISLAMKEGHRDARHAAAEIALNADTEIERLRARVTELETVLSQYADKNNWGYYDESGCDKGHGQHTDACFIGPELARDALGRKSDE